MKIGILQDPLFREHENGPGHPERPQRLDAVATAVSSFLAEAGGDAGSQAGSGTAVELPTRDASIQELERVHSAEYLQLLETTATRERSVFDVDTQANSRSFAAARRAAGASVAAVDAVVSGKVRTPFVCCRPPGHHAERSRAMGFCFLNNAAVAAAAATEDHGFKRVAIVDWDVHHGNGTQHIFENRQDVLYISLHEYPHYPGTGSLDETGRGDGEGYTVNVPMIAGSGNSDYACAMDRVVLPILREYEPELIIVSAGFDGHRLDPLADMMLDGRAYSFMTRGILDVAHAASSGRVVHLLEGGYDSAGLIDGVGAVLRTLTEPSSGRVNHPGQSAGRQPEAPVAETRPQIIEIVEAVRRRQAAYWSVPGQE